MLRTPPPPSARLRATALIAFVLATPAVVATAALLPPAAAAVGAPGSREWGGRVGEQPAFGARVVASDPTGLEIDVQLPPAQLQQRPSLDDPTCSEWSVAPLPGFGVPISGAYGWLVAVPDPTGAALEFVSAAYMAAPRRLCAKPTGAEASDADIGRADTDAVGAVRLERAGILRGQALVRLVVPAALRALDGNVAIRKSLRVRLSYPDPNSIVWTPPPDGAFEPVFRQVLTGPLFPGRKRLTPEARAHGADDARQPESPSSAYHPAADPDALKILVDADGPVRVTGADLAAAGWDLSRVDPTRVSLASGGTPVALTGNATLTVGLAPTDWLEFQGRAMSGEYTRDNVYWLRHTSGLWAEGADASPDLIAGQVFSFPAAAHFEEDTVYFASMRIVEGTDRWMWGNAIHAPTTVTRSVWLPEVAPASSGRITVTIQGYSNDPAVSPDHHARVLWNGVSVADARFDGLGEHVVTATTAPDLLRSGLNRVTLEFPGDTGAAVDAAFLNHVEAAYTGAYVTHTGRLDFAVPAAGRHTITLQGFTSRDIAVVDVTEPAQPVRLEGARIEDAKEGVFRATFSLEGRPDSRFRAWQRGAASAPVRVVANTASALHSGGVGADYLAIAHRRLLPAVAPLLAHRREQGMRVAAVDVEDVYDEFSDGVFDPRAIKAFLAHAYDNWPRPAPTYVLLVGESNLDYRGGYRSGPPNLIPTLRINIDLPGDLGATASDLEFVTLDGDDPLPEMLIGRISAERPAQVEAAVAKILAFEAAPMSAAWRRRGVFVADDSDPAAFESFSARLARFAGGGARHFLAGTWPRDRDLTADISQAVSDGALAVNFVGHGNVDMWGPWPGGGRIFQNADIGRLTNSRAYPVLTTATCMNGWIDHPLRPQSMAELWVVHDHGGVAAWTPSGYTFVAGQTTLFEAFYAGLFGLQSATLGALTVRAAVAAYGESGAWADVVRMFVLLGDPATAAARGGVPKAYLPAMAP